MKKIVIVGSGLTGCLTAFKIAKKYPNFQITLIESSNKILQSFDSIKFSEAKLNNGYHALEINRCKDLFSFFTKNLKLKFICRKGNRLIIINNYLLKENLEEKFYPEKLRKCFKKKKILSNNLNVFYKNILGSFKKTIKETSKRYSNKISEVLNFFIPWFLPKEFIYISKDEGNTFREKIKKDNKKNLVGIPNNGLVESISKSFKKKLLEISNLKIKLNTSVVYNNKEIYFLNNFKKLNMTYDYLFICTSPIFFLKKDNKILLNRLTNNQKFFVCCVVEFDKIIKRDFTEIICMIRNFREMSRFSKINFKKNQKKCLIEFIFNDLKTFKKKITKKRIESILYNIAGEKNDFKIIDYKCTRKIFFPEKSVINECKEVVYRITKKMNTGSKVFF